MLYNNRNHTTLAPIAAKNENMGHVGSTLHCPLATLALLTTMNKKSAMTINCSTRIAPNTGSSVRSRAAESSFNQSALRGMFTNSGCCSVIQRINGANNESPVFITLANTGRRNHATTLLCTNESGRPAKSKCIGNFSGSAGHS